ncbi:MAG: hypothetical protein NVSMB56_16260 [Pyrinomonadaceae bacterium]
MKTCGDEKFIVNNPNKLLFEGATKLSSSRFVFYTFSALAFIFYFGFPHSLHAQKNKPNIAPITPPTLTRTTTRHETRRLGYGGTLTLRGAPSGSITIEGWARNEIDVTADIELHANTEDELARLAAVNNFLLTSDPNQINIVTIGTHDREYMKRTAKNFPKNLIGLAWKIDYHIRVPAYTNLEISNGRGALKVEGIEGAMRFEAQEADAKFVLSGGDVTTVIQRGTVNVHLTQRNWRGHGAEFNLANGELNVELPPNFSGDINAEVLTNGNIENTYGELKPRDEQQTSTAVPANPRILRTRAGAGGSTLSFVVGNGTLRLKKQ